jgi:ankyrin repeat protein
MRSPGICSASSVVALALLAAGCAFVGNDNLNQAALAGDRARCEALLKKGADVNGAGMHDMKPLMSAAKGGNLETARYLVSKGADVNAHNGSGSALVWAVNSGNEELVRFLLVSGANPEWTNALGSTVVDFARQKGATNMIPILQARPLKAELGAPPNGGPAEASENSGVSGGPPSVS